MPEIGSLKSETRIRTGDMGMEGDTGIPEIGDPKPETRIRSWDMGIPEI